MGISTSLSCDTSQGILIRGRKAIVLLEIFISTQYG